MDSDELPAKIILPSVQNNGEEVPAPAITSEVDPVVSNMIQDEKNSHSQSGTSLSNLNPSITDPSSELTEDDIFRMKNLTTKREHLLSDDQGMNYERSSSAISQVDSQSNYEDELNTNYDESIAASTQQDQEELDDSDYQNQTSTSQEQSHNSMSYAQAARKGTRQQIIVQNGYVFGRDRIEPRNFKLSQTVSVLSYPFEPTLAINANNGEYRKALSEAKVYLVGTAHFSTESQQDVIKTIQQVQPDLVMVELCSSRISILSMNEQILLSEASNLNREKIFGIIRQSGLVQGLLQILLLSTSAHITRQLGMAPGGEFRAAHEESRRILNCSLILGDRPLQITIKRAINSLTFFQKLRFLYHIILANNAKITQDDVERCKDKDMLESVLKDMADKFPRLARILVEERDMYMTSVLHNILQKTTHEKYNASKEANVDFEPVVAVAVVGIGHVNGIVSNWGTHIDNSMLLSIPHSVPTFTERLIKVVLRTGFYALAGYTIYKAGKIAYRGTSCVFSAVHSRFTP